MKLITNVTCNHLALHPFWVQRLVIAFWAMLSLAASSTMVCGQAKTIANVPPGSIGRLQAYRIPQGNGYFQPVQVRVSDGLQVAVLNETQFTQPAAAVLAAMQVGSTYRLKVTNINGFPGSEVYPSIEIINRLYPPDQMAERFPVICELSLADMESALEGNYVLKVVYLEDPKATSIQVHDGKTQPYFDLSLGEDPLNSAELFGRPMAIIRIGSRVPINDAGELQLDSAPLTLLTADGETGQPAQVFNLNQQYAERDPSYVPQLSPPRVGNEDLWNMEHIFDGGDRDKQATVGLGDNWTVDGVETEDTVGHFDTLDGQRLVAPSNRIAIYSPRFAAVRQRVGVITSLTEVPALIADRTQSTMLEASKAQAGTTAQNEQARLARDAALAEGVRQQTRPSWSNNLVSPISTTDRVGALENISLLKYNFIEGSEKAVLAKGRVAAITWGGVDGVHAIANFQAVDILFDIKSANEIVESHSPNDRPKLRIIKIASKDAAQPGETVEFTLRFDNVGDQKIGNVTLMDNLTDRLEFVDGSASCSLKCKFYVKDNQQGSQMLRWDIEPSLGVTEGGVVKFTCKIK